MEYNNIHREIVESCKQGQAKAQLELYQLYSKAMYNICLRMAKNEMDAEDLLQNSFVDILQNSTPFAFNRQLAHGSKGLLLIIVLTF